MPWNVPSSSQPGTGHATLRGVKVGVTRGLVDRFCCQLLDSLRRVVSQMSRRCQSAPHSLGMAGDPGELYRVLSASVRRDTAPRRQRRSVGKYLPALGSTFSQNEPSDKAGTIHCDAFNLDK